MTKGKKMITALHHVLCVLAIITGTTAACPSGYSVKSGGCYKVYTKASKTYSEALNQCRSENADLAVVRGTTDNDLFANLIYSGRFWIGLKRETPPHPIWRYIDDGVAVQNQGCYKYDTRNTGFTFYSTPYNNISYKLCADRCRDDNRGYRYAAITWDSHVFKCGCAMEGFRDEQYDSANKQRYENGCDQTCPDNGDTPQYCGGLRFSTVLKIGGTGFDQWAAGQTNNYDGYQTCAALVTQHTPDKLGDEGCHREFSYICQDANHNFRVHEDKATWFEARNRCRRDYQGGDLAHLKTPKERDSLNPLSSANYWIGLTNTLWKWPNGETATWTNWAYNKPYTKAYECVYFDTSSRRWTDVDCSAKMDNFICTTDDTATTTSTTSTTTTTTTTTTTRPTTTTTRRTTTTTTTKRPNPTTTTTTTIATPSTTANNNNNGGTNNQQNPANSAASTGNGSSSLSVIEIILIVVCITLIIIVIIMIVIIVYYKRKNNRKNRIGGYDGRPVAPVPYSGSIGDEVYLPANDYGSSSGSETNLIKPGRATPKYIHSPRPEYRISIEEKY